MRTIQRAKVFVEIAIQTRSRFNFDIGDMQFCCNEDIEAIRSAFSQSQRTTTHTCLELPLNCGTLHKEIDVNVSESNHQAPCCLPRKIGNYEHYVQLCIISAPIKTI